MAALPLDEGITFCRLLAQDSSLSLQGLDDTQWTSLINDRYMAWYKNIEQRAERVALVSDYATGALEQQTQSSATYPEILSVALGNSDTSVRDTVLERMEWNDLQDLQDYDGTLGAPTRYAIFKAHGANETWTIALHPIPSVDYPIIALVRVYPAALTGTDVPELGEFEANCVYRLAAAEGAKVLGAPELVEGILAPVPDDIRGKMGVERKRLDPKRRPEESVL